MTRRHVNPNALALRHALQSSLKPLREAALEVLHGSLRRHRGNAIAVARELDVDRRTLGRWLREYPELGEFRDRCRRVRGSS